MKKRSLPLLVLPLMASLGACMKFETYPVPAQSNGCKVSTAYLNGAGGAPADTANFTWNGNNITKVALGSFRYDIDYNGNLVTKRTFYQNGASAPFRYDQFVYNPAANYLMTRYEQFEQDAPGAFYRADSTVFRFSSGLLAGFTQWGRSSAGSPIAIWSQQVFSYNGSNLAQVLDISYTNGVADDTTINTITTNEDPNYFTPINDRFWMVNPQTINDGMDAIRYSLTRNSITQEFIGGIPRAHSYTTDDKGNLSEYKSNGAVTARYRYNCP